MHNNNITMNTNNNITKNDLDTTIQQATTNKTIQQQQQITTHKLQSNTRYLKLHIKQLNSINIDIDTDKYNLYKLQCIVVLDSIRYTSNLIDIQSDNDNIQFSTTCLFTLTHNTITNKMLTIEQILKYYIHKPIQITINLYNIHTNSYDFITTQYYCWHGVLIHGKIYDHKLSLYTTNELTNQINLFGQLYIDIELLPLKYPTDNNIKPIFIEQDIVNKSLIDINKQYNIITNKFNTYAKQYWLEYIESNKALHSKRLIKLFVQCEHIQQLNNNDTLTINNTQYNVSTNQFICTLIQPIYTHYCLPSIQHILRFVRLIAYKQLLKIGGESTNIYYNITTILALKYTDIDNHNILLCNLLLGYQLDAYVCIGLNHNNNITSFVLVRNSSNYIYIYDSINGVQYEINNNNNNMQQQQYSSNIPYKTLYSCFNHNSYYANIQSNDNIYTIDYNFENGLAWKAMSKQAIVLLPRYIQQSNIIIQPCTLNITELTLQCINQLKSLIIAYRRDVAQLDTIFDNQLSYILQQQLVIYEQERLYGIDSITTQQKQYFDMTLKNNINNDYTFTACPFHTVSHNMNELMNNILQHNVASSIMLHSDHDTKHALTIHITPYAENIVSIWCIIASTRYVTQS